ncbi:MAG: hypothetical protein KBD78_09005 [Oligoflexales bacterium]|nr:hypothetical protein [Oligoflexales bacterium]
MNSFNYLLQKFLGFCFLGFALMDQVTASSLVDAVPILENAKLQCNYCHSSPDRSKIYAFADFKTFKTLPFKKDPSCSYCHISNLQTKRGKAPAWLPLDPERIPENHYFQKVPPLILQVKASGSHQTINRFNDCGLKAFLAAPKKRYAEEPGYMYSLPSNTNDDVVNSLLPYLDSCSRQSRAIGTTNSKEEFALGLKTYKNLCQSCHDSGQAPRIKLSIPLLSFAYFQQKVRLGASLKPRPYAYKWQRQGDKLYFYEDSRRTLQMPGFDLSSLESKALYAYLTTSTNSEKISKTKNDGKQKIGAENLLTSNLKDSDLFSVVKNDIFNGSCKHCHSPSEKVQAEIMSVFASKSKELPVFPLPKLEVQPNALLEKALSEGGRCEETPILKRLMLRHEEIGSGLLNKEQIVRGMPLGSEPLPITAISLLREWLRSGCPGAGEAHFCRPCND